MFSNKSIGETVEQCEKASNVIRTSGEQAPMKETEFVKYRISSRQPTAS